MKRVSERINKGSPLAQKAFTAIAYHHIPKAATPEDVTTLFNVLAGEEDVSEAAAIMPECSVVQQCSQEQAVERSYALGRVVEASMTSS